MIPSNEDHFFRKHFYTPVLIILKDTLLTFISSWVPIVVGVSFLGWRGFLVLLGSGKNAGRLSSPLGNTILLWVSAGDGKNPLGPDSLWLLDRTVISFIMMLVYLPLALFTNQVLLAFFWLFTGIDRRIACKAVHVVLVLELTLTKLKTFSCLQN